MILKIKAWEIALTGILLQILIGIVYLNSISKDQALSGFVFGVVGVVLLFGSGIGILPMLLLMFKKTRKIGVIISFVLGVVGVVFRFGLIVGIFLIISGFFGIKR